MIEIRPHNGAEKPVSPSPSLPSPSGAILKVVPDIASQLREAFEAITSPASSTGPTTASLPGMPQLQSRFNAMTVQLDTLLTEKNAGIQPSALQVSAERIEKASSFFIRTVDNSSTLSDEQKGELKKLACVIEAHANEASNRNPLGAMPPPFPGATTRSEGRATSSMARQVGPEEEAGFIRRFGYGVGAIFGSIGTYSGGASMVFAALTVAAWATASPALVPGAVFLGVAAVTCGVSLGLSALLKEPKKKSALESIDVGKGPHTKGQADPDSMLVLPNVPTGENTNPAMDPMIGNRKATDGNPVNDAWQGNPQEAARLDASAARGSLPESKGAFSG